MTGSADLNDEFALADTNVLVYAHDPADAAKHAAARRLMSELLNERRLVLSAQTLNEFFSTMTRPTRETRLSPDEATEILRDLSGLCPIIPMSADISFRAMDAASVHGFSFWDALIWAAAKEAGADTLYTEDFQHGRDIEGVRIVNPFLIAP